MNQEQLWALRAFLDAEGKLRCMPARRRLRGLALAYVASRFAAGVEYTEKQVNRIVTDAHAFGDYFLVRRELVDWGFLQRTRDGARYWVNPNAPRFEGEDP